MVGCGGGSGSGASSTSPPPPPAVSSLKAITAYSLNGTDVTALIATFTTTGAGVSIAGVPQVSGATANNFSAPLSYTVTAADGSTASYTVSVTVATIKDNFMMVGGVGVINKLSSVGAYTNVVAPSYSLNAVMVSSDGTFIAVGVNGTILTSPDGVSWTLETSGTNNNLAGVTVNSSGIFVAIGDIGAILTSPDGTTWTPVSAISAASLYAIVIF